ncbi:MAG: hypothetical protein F4X76_12640 [Chloroflexi bacterium]|nr:hypothetical protein [Chloroflexota bacterium]
MPDGWRVEGEVSEREELLDGRFQVVLDGAAEEAPGIEVSWTLVWLLGRQGEVSLSEGYVTVVEAERGELNASLEAGTVLAGDETGAAQVRASFAVDAVDGTLAAEGDRVTCDLEVGVEQWAGELRVGGDAT